VATPYLGVGVLGVATPPKLSMTTIISTEFAEATNVHLVDGIRKYAI